jgi:hypothetical protein
MLSVNWLLSHLVVWTVLAYMYCYHYDLLHNLLSPDKLMDPQNAIKIYLYNTMHKLKTSCLGCVHLSGHLHVLQNKLPSAFGWNFVQKTAVKVSMNISLWFIYNMSLFILCGAISKPFLLLHHMGGGGGGDFPNIINAISHFSEILKNWIQMYNIPTNDVCHYVSIFSPALMMHVHPVLSWHTCFHP